MAKKIKGKCDTLSLRITPQERARFQSIAAQLTEPVRAQGLRVSNAAAFMCMLAWIDHCLKRGVCFR